MQKESLERLLDAGISIERIARRFGKDPSTVSYWMKKYGLVSANAEKHAAKGGIERQRLEEMVRADLTVGEIADAVGLSRGAVRHWLRVHGLKTTRARGQRLEIARAAKDAGLLNVTMRCRRHGETDFILEGRGYYRCRRCRAEAVVRHRQKVKAVLVREAGGRCCICGYDSFIGALEFHHLDPSEKRLGLSGQGVTYSMNTLRAEAKKCVLVCANCHAEVEGGAAAVPATVLRAYCPGS